MAQHKDIAKTNIIHEISGLDVTLRYIRDAIMHLYMEMPLRKFFMLIGNLPLYDDEVQKYLEGMIN